MLWNLSTLKHQIQTASVLTIPLGSEEDFSLQPASTVLTVSQFLCNIVDSINGYNSAMDPDKALPNDDEGSSTMKRGCALLHAHMPVKEGHSLTCKCQRQRPK